MFAQSVLALALTLTAPAGKPAAFDASKMEGEWILEKYIQGGKENADRAGNHYTIKDGKVSVREEGDKPLGFAVDAKAEPVALDLDGGAIKAICKLEGDTLTVCFPKGGKADWPTKFESPEGTKIVILILKREKR